MQAQPFSSAADAPASTPRFVVNIVDAVTGLTTLQRLYQSGVAMSRGPFPERALAALDITVVAEEALDRVPPTGPLVVVANHPHGAIDGLAVAQLLARVRPDVKLLGNALLGRIPEMRAHLVPCDVFGTDGNANGRGLRAALAWLRDGHALVVFPAGEVSHVATADGRLVDASWRDGAARLAAHASAPVLPIFMDGRNSRLFERAGRLSPWLRTAMLGRELLAKRGQTIAPRIGRVVSPRRLAAVGDATSQTAYLRIRTYALADDLSARGSVRRPATRARRSQPVADAVAPAVLAREVAGLPAETCLIAQGPWRVYLVGAGDAPQVLLEIGRLREHTFRGAGEGTGRSRDLDRFDWHYRHLFVWHTSACAIAGAYRLAATDDILPRHGLGGFYTRTLFRYPEALLRELGPALELGRSFVREDYQRDYQPLLLLWRGIGAIVAAAPRYRTLFGPVSISAEYRSTTRAMLARFLLANRPSLLRGLVEPRRPLPVEPFDSAALVYSRTATDVAGMDELVRELEAGQRGLPVLLRQYLKLNARLLGFSVDPAFGGVLDGLVVVDLLDVDAGSLARYFGKDRARALVAAHASAGSPAPGGALQPAALEGLAS